MKIIAHRSGPAVYPEQTIRSALHALEWGADYIELDVRYTADKAIAVCHDDDAGRVFGVDKEIKDMSTEEFLSLRHKDNPAYCSHLFEDYLRANALPMLIHIKEDAVIDDLIAMLKKYNCLDKVVFGAGSVAAVEKIKSDSSDNKVLAFMPGEKLAADFARAGADYIRLWEMWLSQENIQSVLDTGKPLWIMVDGGEGYGTGYTSDEMFKKIFDLNPDGILINDLSDIKRDI